MQYSVKVTNLLGRIFEVEVEIGGKSYSIQVADSDPEKVLRYAHAVFVPDIVRNNWELDGLTLEHPDRETYCPTPPPPAPTPEPEPEPTPDEPTPEGGDGDAVLP